MKRSNGSRVIDHDQLINLLICFLWKLFEVIISKTKTQILSLYNSHFLKKILFIKSL